MLEVNNSELETLRVEGKKNAISGNYDKAIEIYNYMLTRYADNSVAVEHANFHLGDIFIMLENFALAEKHIKTAINLDPGKPYYHFSMGIIFIDHKQWNKAISELEIARAGLPKDGNVLHMLGYAVSRSGDETEGLSLLEEAGHLTPNNPAIFFDMAVIYLLSGNVSKAKVHAERAMQLDPLDSLNQKLLNIVLNSSDYVLFT
jgi:tetratricopeptide (TPR) repeat protein